MWMDGGMGWGGGWSIFGAVHMLLWWGLLIFGIAVLAKWLFTGDSREERQVGNRALEILRERYARGEIGKEEFELRKRDLDG